MSNEHGVTLLETDMQEICNIVNEMQLALDNNVLVNDIIYSLNNNTDEWVFDRFTAVNVESGMVIWVAGGVNNVRVETTNSRDAISETTDKRRIYKAVMAAIDKDTHTT